MNGPEIFVEELVQLGVCGEVPTLVLNGKIKHGAGAAARFEEEEFPTIVKNTCLVVQLSTRRLPAHCQDHQFCEGKFELPLRYRSEPKLRQSQLRGRPDDKPRRELQIFLFKAGLGTKIVCTFGPTAVRQWPGW